jgi:hypothetical protein
MSAKRGQPPPSPQPLSRKGRGAMKSELKPQVLSPECDSLFPAEEGLE